MVDGPNPEILWRPVPAADPGQVPTRPTEPHAVDRGRWLPFCKLAAESVFGVAGDLRDEVGGTQARLVLGSLPYFSGHRPLRPELPAAATVFAAEYVSAIPNPAGWILTEEVTSKKAELLSRL